MLGLHGKLISVFRYGWLFPLLAFLIPLLVRAVPEVLMGPYVTGFDIMAHYVPTVENWNNGNIDLGGFFGTAPLFYAIVLLVFSGGNSLFMVLKVLAVVLHGFLGLSIFGFARQGLGWGYVKSLAVALLASLYFVALRISWDMLRSELALIFLFLALMLFGFSRPFSGSAKRYLVLALVMVFVVLSEQLLAAILLGIIGLTLMHRFVAKKFVEVKRLFVVCLPAVAVFLSVFFFSSSVPEFRLIFGFSQTDGWLALFGFSSYLALFVSTTIFLLFCFLPLIPFAFLGLRKFSNLQLIFWALICLILSFVPLVSPSNLRWAMLLVYPLAFFVIAGVDRLRMRSVQHSGLKLLSSSLVFLVVVTSVFSGGLILGTAEQPFFYFSDDVNPFVYQLPTSMLQNTVSISDCPDVTSAMEWLSINMIGSDRLLSHRAFYGWEIYYLNSSQLILYEYDNPSEVAPCVLSQVNGSIYLVWWVNGQGWYGQSNVSSAFHEVHVSGRIAVYQYFE